MNAAGKPAPSRLDPSPNKKIIHISTTAAHVNRCCPPAIEVIGDLAETLRHLAQLTVRIQEPEQAFALRDEMLKEYASCEEDSAHPIKPQRILSNIRKTMQEGDILLSDVSAHKMWIARHYLCDEPNSCLISNGFATMDIAVPGALAAKLLHPRNRILAVNGDGGFMMNCQELETARREDLRAILDDAFRQDVPAVIDCPVDYRENTLLTKHLKELIESH